MATYLAALGRLSYRRRGRVILIWVLLLGVLGGFGASVGSVGSGGALTVPGTESQDARDALAREFPDAAGATGTIVIRRDAGGSITDAVGQAAVADVVAEAKDVPEVVAVVGPEVTNAYSADDAHALVQVSFSSGVNDLDEEVKETYEEIGDDLDGVTVAPGGEIAAVSPEAGPTEAVGVVLAAVVLLVTFGSLVAAGMTLLTALFGVAVGMSGVLVLSAFVDFTAVTPILALMLGLAVGIDYALFINSRYRQEIERGADGEEAAGIAVGTAGSAVVFAGLTVIIALAGLAVVGVPFLGVMGLVASAAVLVAVLVAITLTPAVAGYGGRRVLSRRTRRGETAVRTDSLGLRWVNVVTSHARTVLVVGAAALILLAIPVGSMRLALPDNTSAPEDTAAHQSAQMITEGFGPGYNAQLALVTTSDDTGATEGATADLAAALADVEDIVLVAPAQVSQDGLTTITTVVPSAGPTDRATTELVGQLRDDVLPAVESSAGVDIAVTGVAAVAIDVSATLADALPIYLLVVIGLSILLLMIVFRSVLVPIKAAAGFLLTIVATFGVTTAVFQWGWGAELLGATQTGPLVSFLPILLVGVLFGLSMDYEVFLVSRMREEFVHGADSEQAVVAGFSSAARVVGAAAVIMVAVFAGFVISPDQSVKLMGFALALGVLIDAFVVRMTLVPAVMTLLGRRAWHMPRWLDRILPDLDIEGAKLERTTSETPSPDHSTPDHSTRTAKALS